MVDRLASRIAFPMVVISLLLLGLGAAAAWNVQKQQVTTQNLIVNELEGLLAIQRVYTRTREILNLLQQHLSQHDRATLPTIEGLKEETQSNLRDAQRWPRTVEEEELMDQIVSGYEVFWADLEQTRGIMSRDERDARLSRLADEVLTERIIVPAELYMHNSHAVVARTNEASQRTTDLTRQGFLLLGLCGCAGGLISGWAMARAIRHSLVRLDISVRGVADRLGAVAGPVTFTQEGGVDEIEAGLSQMEQHIVALVERLQQSEMQMLRSEQLAAVGQLAAGLAHELRNPLMPIKTLVQTAIERGGGKGLTDQALVVIEREIQRLETSIQTFLDFARPQVPAKVRFDLVDRVHQTLELVSTRARQQGIEIRGHLPAEPLMIEADSGQVQQVLLNLLLNGMEALTAGGVIEVSASHVPDVHGDTVVLEISDNGPGLDEAVLGRIFEPFVTTKETGTGLGLSICQRLIQGHGGSIVAGNLPSGGAVFTITLPVSESPAADAAA